MNAKTILVTGSNRGIGFEIVNQLAELNQRVILSSRNEVKGKPAVDQLRSRGLQVDFIPLDISNQNSITAAVGKIKSEFGKLDVLINNAAILLKEDQSLLKSDWKVITETIQSDALDQLNLIRNFVKIIPDGGRIINTSSGGGSMSDSVGGWSPAYCVSKSFLNSMTRHLAYELVARKILVNAYCPGWVKTDMGGRSAPRNVKQGADTAVWLATSNISFTGKIFRDRKEITW